MDNVIVDFKSGIKRLPRRIQNDFKGHLDDVPGIFALMDPMKGAIKSVELLQSKFDTYVLSTAPWGNPSAWIDKVEWIQRYFGAEEESPLYKRLILTHHKNLNDGDFLIDDRKANGVENFKGRHIHFGKKKFSNWPAVTKYLMSL